MNRKKNQQPLGKGAMTVMWIIIAAIMVFAASNDSDAVIPSVATIVVVTAILLAVSASNKKAAAKKGGKQQTVELNRPFPTPKAAKQPSSLFRHSDEAAAEEAVSCHHLTGREKYIQQLDSYLKAGLIDRAEYKLMKERYQKLEIPEDYH